MFNLHSNWVDIQNAFNFISYTTFYQKLWFFIITLDKKMLFALFFQHKDFIIISFKFNTQQGDPLGGT